jgi:hypothetical protein
VPVEWSFVFLINNPLGLLENHGTVRIWPPGIFLNNIQSRYKKGHYGKPKHQCFQKDEQKVFRHEENDHWTEWFSFVPDQGNLT